VTEEETALPGRMTRPVGLFSYILHGFGFTLGARAADEALEQLEKSLEKSADPRLRAKAERAERARQRAEAKAKSRLERERKREKARQAEEVDAELESLKKRFSQER
jgi:hypothetical protein